MKLTNRTVLVEPDELPNKTRTGIFITEATHVNQRTGIVKATGPECDTVQPGDRVLYFSRRAVPTGTLQLVNEDDDILAILAN